MRIALTALAVAVCCLASWHVWFPPLPRLLYNTSRSAVVGWYVLEPKNTYDVGSKVAAFAPKKAREFAEKRDYLPAHIPLLKTIWAGSGDDVCIKNGVLYAPNRPQIRINAVDHIGRMMPILSGCFTLKEGEVFLLSTDVQASWDSRYFGPVPHQNILGQITYLGPTWWSAAQQWAGHG